MSVEPYYSDASVALYHGDALAVLKSLPDASVDSVVTDPPYGLEFMGKEWDAPWKSSSVGRGARVAAERADELTERGKGHTTSAGPYLASGVDSTRVAGKPFQGWCELWATECLRVLKPGGHMLAFGGTRTFHRLACAVEDAGFEIRDSICWLYGSGFPKHRAALKPAFEPIVMARKPFGTSLIVNEAKYGTGALNIDGCRVAGVRSGDPDRFLKTRGIASSTSYSQDEWTQTKAKGVQESAAGRWPANVVLDGSQADELDAQSGTSQSRIGKPRGAGNGAGWGMTATGAEYDDAGGPSRYFPTFRYEAKAPTIERPRQGEIAHPTVKPLDLMRWLIRLVTPPGGTVLEPFAGSGTTIEAAILEGFDCIGIEREATYLPLITQRINRRRDPVAYVKASGDDGGLFDLLDGTPA